jgi:hypothetical protein
MCPLLLKKKENHQAPESFFDPEWMQMVANHYRLAQECLATTNGDSSQNSLALRALVNEDVPAILEKIAGFTIRTTS